MTYWEKKLTRDQLDERLSRLKALSAFNLETGWIKTIREALGMSTKQLGKKVGIDQSRISRLENAEIEGDLKLSSLKKVAEGLNMRLVYFFVPDESLEQMVHKQARTIAQKRLDKVNQTMRLEDQELSEKDKAKAMEDLTQKILIDEPKTLWDQDVFS
jgi:predicted DNA-binding mobile mystery protein A